MDTDHRIWNDRQKQLRTELKDCRNFRPALFLFLQQHAWVHDSAVSQCPEKTFADAAWEGIDPSQARRIPPGREHSCVWLAWHMARIEDVTMNVLVAGGVQVFQSGGWQERMLSPFTEIGNAMPAGQRALLSEALDVTALREYRVEVGKRTREVVGALSAHDLRQKPTPERLQRLLDEKAVDPASQGVLQYWGGLSLAGLLLMPPTRHNLIHLNEMAKLKFFLIKA